MREVLTAPGTRLELDAIGTRWTIDVDRPWDPALEAAVRREIAVFDATWSRFRADSFVTDLASAPRRHHVDADGVAMLDLYRTLADVTGGAVNPLVGHALEARGYDSAPTLRPRPDGPDPVPPWAALGWELASATVDPTRPVLLDVGAVGKGRLVDLVADVLTVAGVGSATVDAGGDLRHRDRTGRALRVALEHPWDPTRAVGLVRVPGEGAAICASAVNRRAWGDEQHHVLDARTGEPVRDVVATWAVAPTAMLADAAATAAFFLAPGDVLAALPGATGVVRMPATGPLQAVGIDGQVFA